MVPAVAVATRARRHTTIETELRMLPSLSGHGKIPPQVRSRDVFSQVPAWISAV
jgi:hypothetical protein